MAFGKETTLCMKFHIMDWTNIVINNACKCSTSLKTSYIYCAHEKAEHYAKQIGQWSVVWWTGLSSKHGSHAHRTNDSYKASCQ